MGVIGVGWWGTVGHLQPLIADPQADVVAVWSRTGAKARSRAREYSVPESYTDYRQMIDDCSLDAVCIASTPNMHYEQARYCLEQGVHVLMEKPFVLKAKQARELQRLARDNDLLLSVCHPVLYNPTMAKARDLIRGGTLGELLMVTAIHAQRVYDLYKGDVAQVWESRARDMPRPNTNSYSDPAIAGGGEGYTQVSHILGTLLWLTGLEPVSVYAYMNNRDLAVDVVDAMTIRFSNGALGTVSANGLLPAGVSSRLVQVHGDKGILNWDTVGSSAHVLTDAEEGSVSIELPTPEGHDPRAAVPRNFVRAVLGEEPQYVERDVAIYESLILDAAYRSAATGQEAMIEA